MEKPRRAEPQPAASVRLIDQIAKMTFGKLCNSFATPTIYRDCTRIAGPTQGGVTASVTFRSCL